MQDDAAYVTRPDWLRRVPARRAWPRIGWALLVGGGGSALTVLVALISYGLWLDDRRWWDWLLVPFVHLLVACTRLYGQVRAVSLVLLAVLAVSGGARIWTTVHAKRLAPEEAATSPIEACRAFLDAKLGNAAGVTTQYSEEKVSAAAEGSMVNGWVRWTVGSDPARTRGFHCQVQRDANRWVLLDLQGLSGL